MQAKRQVVKSIFQLGRFRSFSTQNTMLGSINPDANHSLRVMSTPTWPVPYYQRIFKHPVNQGDIDKGNLSYVTEECSDIHAIMAKQNLRAQGLGYVVEAVENHADTTTYCTSFADSTKFSNAYAEDLLDCLDVAFNQSKRVLNDIDLADTLLHDLKK